MLALSLIQWWYFEGWKTFIKLLFQKISDHADYFSFGTIFKTFFAPFRQIDSDAGGKSMSDRFSAFVNRTISRIIGSIIRFFIILAGLVVISFEFTFGLILVILWPAIPAIPVAGIILAASGLSFGVLS